MNNTFEYIKQELVMTFKTRIRYKVGIVSDLVIMSLTYIFVYFFQTGLLLEIYYDTTKANGNILFLLGFLFWQFGTLSLGFTTSMITEESATGKLEMKMQGKYALSFIYFIKLLANLMTNILLFIFVILITLVLGTHDIDFLRLILSVLFTIPSILGMYGMGLIIGALTLKEKNISSFVIIIQTMLIFVSNAIAPIDYWIIKLIPFSQGIDLARNFYLGKTSEVIYYIIYISINLCWLLIGIALFNFFLKRERMYGSFDTY